MSYAKQSSEKPPGIKEWTEDDIGWTDGGYEDFYEQHDRRRPVVYDPYGHTLHIGPFGSSHGQVERIIPPSPNQPKWEHAKTHQGWIGPNSEAIEDGKYGDDFHETPEGKEYGWYAQDGSDNERPPEHVNKALGDFVGGKEQTGWHFAKKDPRTEFSEAKVFTDEVTHARSLKIHQKVQEAPRTAAADPEWLKHWIEHNGPYLQHSTTERAYPLILRDGLLPHDRGPGSQYDGHLVPRENSVYMRTPDAQRGAANLYIDLRKLDPKNLIEDEDQMHGVRGYHEGRLDPFTHLESYPEPIQSYPQGAYEGVHGQGFRPYAHNGDWADNHEEGDKDTPDRVARSLNGPRVHLGMPGTIAHRGSIPPEAIIPHWKFQEESLQNKWGQGPRGIPHQTLHPSQLAYHRANPGRIVDHFRTLPAPAPMGRETNHIYPIHLADDGVLHIGSGRHQTPESITGGLTKSEPGRSNLRGAGWIEQAQNGKAEPTTLINFDNGVHDGDHTTHGGVTHEQAQHVQKLLKDYYGHENVEYDPRAYREPRLGSKSINIVHLDGRSGHDDGGLVDLVSRPIVYRDDINGGTAYVGPEGGFHDDIRNHKDYPGGGPRPEQGRIMNLPGRAPYVHWPVGGRHPDQDAVTKALGLRPEDHPNHNGWHFAHETDSMSSMKIATKPRKSPGAHVKAHWGKHPKAMKKLK